MLIVQLSKLSVAFEEALQQIIKWDHLSDKEIQKQI